MFNSGLTGDKEKASNEANWTQGESKALDERRQQCGRRHRALRTRTGLPGAERHYRQRLCIYSLRRIRYNSFERTSMVEDGDAGDNGFGGSIAKGIRDANYESGVWGIPGHCMIDQKSMNAYWRR